MKSKKVLTINLKPGMITSEDTYDSSNHMILPGNTKLNWETIRKLRSLSIPTVRIQVAESAVPSEPTPVMPANASPQTQSSHVSNYMTEPSYFDRIKQSQDFKVFQQEFSNSLSSFRSNLNDIVIKNDASVIQRMLNEVNSIWDKARNPLHLLDMMQCMRGFDDLTYAHSMNVALISRVLGQWLNLNNDELQVLVTCGMLHDIGKLRIPAKIIKKPGKLTDEEYKLIQSHPQFGYDMIMNVPMNHRDRVALSALQHHERYDGTGYPKKLPGAQLDPYSTIIAIADVYDAMTADRCYRKGLCPFFVINQLEQEMQKYSPKVLYLFMQRTIESYINSNVLLSNGETGKVALLNKSQLSKPLVITNHGMHDLSKENDISIVSIL